MVSKELKTIIDMLEKKGQMFFVEGATKKQIAEFEEKNGIYLSTEYKKWLLFSDGGECFLPAGVQFYGVAHKPVISVEDEDRPDSSYTVIGALASGDPILCEKSSEKISIYNLEGARIEDDEIFESFYSFLNSLPELLGIGG